MRRSPNAVDIGHDHWVSWAPWSPDRDLNPQYDGIPDEPHHLLLVWHLTPDGEECASGCTIDTPTARQIEPGQQMWTLESLDPLTISPSLLCLLCGDHGFIRNGRWVPA